MTLSFRFRKIIDQVQAFFLTKEKYFLQIKDYHRRFYYWLMMIDLDE
jgi:hypothetical protein